MKNNTEIEAIKNIIDEALTDWSNISPRKTPKEWFEQMRDVLGVQSRFTTTIHGYTREFPTQEAAERHAREATAVAKRLIEVKSNGVTVSRTWVNTEGFICYSDKA